MRDGSLKISSFDDLIKSCEDIRNILNELNIKLKPSSRLDRYILCVSKVIDLYNKGEQQKVHSIYDNDFVFTSFKEVSSFSSVLSFLDFNNNPNLIDKLQIALEGNPVPDEDNKNDQSRNIHFELELGTWLSRGGLSITWNEPDINIKLDNCYLHFACKRPTSV